MGTIMQQGERSRVLGLEGGVSLYEYSTHPYIAGSQRAICAVTEGRRYASASARLRDERGAVTILCVLG